MRNQRGITLIALVITIIVLLILAGVSIAMLTGQNGILTRANEAGTTTNEKSNSEIVKLAVSNILTDYYAGGSAFTNAEADSLEITEAGLLASIQDVSPDADVDVDVATSSTNLTVTFDNNDQVITVNPTTGAIVSDSADTTGD